MLICSVARVRFRGEAEFMANDLLAIVNSGDEGFVR